MRPRRYSPISLPDSLDLATHITEHRNKWLLGQSAHVRVRLPFSPDDLFLG